jgi:uncharacterized protein
MPRPCKRRRVICNPQATAFKPCGTQMRGIKTITLTMDELEAIRLADYEGLYQVKAAGKMKISRQTFGNIIASAHQKVADFLINAKLLSVEGGTVEIDKCQFVCMACQHRMAVPCGAERPGVCPKCKSNDIYCSKKIGPDQTIKKCWREL